MSQEVNVTIKPDGSLVFVYDDALQPLVAAGDATVKRVSHVEPNERGQWLADMGPVNGPVLGPYVLREDALAAEREWLNQNLGL